jgi:hypothetical protein
MTDQPLNISLNDFVMAVNIIDVCSQRGAFKGDELAVVGQLREKFAAFVKANTPATPTEEKVATETAE